MSEAVGDAEGLRRFRPYPEYKESQDEWLGQFPASWDQARIIRYARLRTGGTPDRTNREYWEDGSIPWLTSGEVNKGVIREVDRKITEAGMRHSNASLLPVNSVLVALNGQGRTKATAALLRVPATCNQSLAAFISDKSRLDPTYLYYYLKSRYADIRGLVGEQRDGLSLGLLKKIPVYLPSLSEQRAIAAFLDRETAKIDALIAKKERLIELLQEKRTALITHAVTNGLDPTVPMKPSGIEWLGEIPAHWEVKRLKNVVTHGVQNGLFKKKDAFGSGTLLVNVFDVYRDRFFVDGDGLERVETDASEQLKYALRDGDVLFVRSSLKLEGVGRSACFVQLDEPVVFECHLVRVSLDKELVRPDFLLHFLNSRVAIARLISLANSVTMTTLPQSSIATLEVPVPTLPEQQAIMHQVGSALDRFDELARKIREAVISLKEYRTALISAAVTGKIDVRDELPAA